MQAQEKKTCTAKCGSELIPALFINRWRRSLPSSQVEPFCCAKYFDVNHVSHVRSVVSLRYLAPVHGAIAESRSFSFLVKILKFLAWVNLTLEMLFLFD